MFHIRAITSRASKPLSVCGAQPEVSVLGYSRSSHDDLGPYTQAATPRLTEWDWVKAVAGSNKNICSECVKIMSRKAVMPGTSEEKFDDTVPF